MIKKILILIITISINPSLLMADYPNTSIGVIDINKILSDADAAIYRRAVRENSEQLATVVRACCTSLWHAIHRAKTGAGRCLRFGGARIRQT